MRVAAECRAILQWGSNVHISFTKPKGGNA